jgi:malonyl-CoA/methylmalonyl-CoA synthetase
VTQSRLLARWLSRAEDSRPVAYDSSGTKTWAEAVDGAERVASGLLAGRTSLEGERIALLVAPGASFVSCLFGVLRADGAVVFLSPLHPPPETEYFCEDAGVRTVVVSPELADHVAFLGPARRLMLTTALLEQRRRPIQADPGEGNAALQLYTSGTTGKPKGAVLTHANVAVQQDLLGACWGLHEGDVLLHVLPLHHMHGLAIALLPTLGAGGAARFLETRPFDAQATWDAMERATVLMGVPTIHAKLFSALDAADAATRARWGKYAASLRLVTSGSSALPVSVGERWRQLTGAYPLERFGMTEVGVAMSNPLSERARRPGTVGMPLDTVKIRVVGDDGRDSEQGELWVSGPSVFGGYHRRADATRAAFAVHGGERWFKTGDTVGRDADGFVRILGRTSVDVLKSGGYKLSALEIEEALRENPAIAEVAVIGTPDPVWGERVVACVVAHEGREEECSEDRLRAFAKTRLASYKVPSRVVLLTELPRNALGKVVKPELAKKVNP